jgi:protein phosphatase
MKNDVGLELARQITPVVVSAQMHPRRGEIMQAIGGAADVAPEMIHARFSPGDWLIVCSDGLTARLTPELMVSILDQSHSADAAARHW